ncbi:UNVERIFIED_CONTAM: hypothetical protein HDU68_001198 [Siphonaria sp. JEL0065]|nr:hypothetical protein HDU68_001198 [Siphonaria sp. JEL0065]
MASEGIMSMLAIENYDTNGNQKQTPGLSDSLYADDPLYRQPLRPHGSNSNQESELLLHDGFLVASGSPRSMSDPDQANVRDRSNGTQTHRHQQDSDQEFDFDSNKRQLALLNGIGDYSPAEDSIWATAINSNSNPAAAAATTSATPSLPSSFVTSFYEDDSSVTVMINTDEFSTMRALRLLRVVRLFKFMRNNQKFMIVLEAVQQSVDGIVILVATLSVMVTFFSSLLFFAEQMNETFDDASGMWVYVSDGSVSPFQSIPHSFYYLLGTLTNNPPAIPKTALGQCIIMVAMILSLFVVAFPLTIITIQYAKTVKTFTQRQKALREERLREKNARLQRKLEIEAKAIASPETVAFRGFFRRKRSAGNDSGTTLAENGATGLAPLLSEVTQFRPTQPQQHLEHLQHSEDTVTPLTQASLLQHQQSMDSCSTSSTSSTNNPTRLKRAVSFQPPPVSRNPNNVLPIQPPANVISTTSAMQSVLKAKTVLRAVSAFKSSLKDSQQSPSSSTIRRSSNLSSSSVVSQLPVLKPVASVSDRPVAPDSLENVQTKVLKLGVGPPRNLEVKVMDWYYNASRKEKNGENDSDEDEDEDHDDDVGSGWGSDQDDAEKRKLPAVATASGGVGVLMTQAEANAISDKLTVRLVVRDEAHFKLIMKTLAELS